MTVDEEGMLQPKQSLDGALDYFLRATEEERPKPHNPRHFESFEGGMPLAYRLGLIELEGGRLSVSKSLCVQECLIRISHCEKHSHARKHFLTSAFNASG